MSIEIFFSLKKNLAKKKKQNIFRIHEKLNKIFAISVDDDDDIRYNDHVDLDVNV